MIHKNREEDNVQVPQSDKVNRICRYYSQWWYQDQHHE